MNRRSFFQTIAAVTTLVLFSGVSAQAEWKPRRPITIVVPFNAGGGADTYARALATGLQAELGVPVTIANKPGSGGIIGATEVAGARTDGTTLLVTTGGAFVMGWIFKDAPVNPFDDFVTVAQIGGIQSSIAVPANSPYKTAADLLEAAKANPGNLRWAHTGRGALHHVAGQSFLDANGLEAVDVPFKGGAAVRAAVIGEQVDFAAIGVQQASGFESEMRVLGVIAPERDQVQPDIPTFAEQQLPYVNINTPVDLFAPKGTDPEIIETLETMTKDVVGSPEFAKTVATKGSAPAFLPGAEAQAALREVEKNARPIIEALKQD